MSLSDKSRLVSDSVSTNAWRMGVAVPSPKDVRDMCKLFSWDAEGSQDTNAAVALGPICG